MRSCPELAQQGSAAAQGLHDDERVVGRQGVSEIEDLAARREEADVSPQPALLVDDAEAQAGIAAVEIGQYGRQRCALRLDLACAGIGTQRGRDQHLHVDRAPGTPISTAKISGRWRAMQCHDAPSSALVHSSPLVVPK